MAVVGVLGHEGVGTLAGGLKDAVTIVLPHGGHTVPGVIDEVQPHVLVAWPRAADHVAGGVVGRVDPRAARVTDAGDLVGSIVSAGLVERFDAIDGFSVAGPVAGTVEGPVPPAGEIAGRHEPVVEVRQVVVVEGDKAVTVEVAHLPARRTRGVPVVVVDDVGIIEVDITVAVGITGDGTDEVTLSVGHEGATLGLDEAIEPVIEVFSSTAVAPREGFGNRSPILR